MRNQNNEKIEKKKCRCNLFLQQKSASDFQRETTIKKNF